MVAEGISKKLMDHAMKFLASDMGQKLIQNPHLMKAINSIFDARGKMQCGVDDSLKTVQKALNLVTREDLATLRKTLRDLEHKLEGLKHHAQELEDNIVKLEAKKAPAKKAPAKKAPAKKK